MASNEERIYQEIDKLGKLIIKNDINLQLALTLVRASVFRNGRHLGQKELSRRTGMARSSWWYYTRLFGY